MDSSDFGASKLRISMLLSLDPAKQVSTVGFHDFSDIAATHGLPHVAIRSIRERKVAEIIEGSRPDYLLVIGWSELVSENILDIPKRINHSEFRHDRTHGGIGMHPTLLPQGRGRAPIPWTIIKGLRETGVTVFLLEEAADAGGVILQERFPVDTEETATTLFAKAADAHYRLAMQLAPSPC